MKIKAPLKSAKFSVIVSCREKQESPQRIMSQHLFFSPLPLQVLLVAEENFIWNCSNNTWPTLSLA